jgi:hypothetical protein
MLPASGPNFAVVVRTAQRLEHACLVTSLSRAKSIFNANIYTSIQELIRVLHNPKAHYHKNKSLPAG